MSVLAHDIKLPDIGQADPFPDVVRKLSIYFDDAIELPSTFEQLRTTVAGSCLHVLVDHLSRNCTNPAIVNALLALKWHYAADSTLQGVGQSRSNACEIVAWRFLARFSQREVLDFCLYEIPEAHASDAGIVAGDAHPGQEAGETSPLISSRPTSGTAAGFRPVGSSQKRIQLLSSLPHLVGYADEDDNNLEYDPTASFEGLNALEIAAVADAKRFLSQQAVQDIITGIWNGTIVFWDSLTATSTKRPRFYDPHRSDPYSRLRVPKYMKYWELVFFGVFLYLFYATLIQREKNHFTGTEIALLLWFVSFFQLELSEWYDAGSVFYSTNVWNFFDMVMIFIGFAFAILRFVGIANHDSNLSGWAFDILSLEALFLIPRIFSILSLSPYLGTMIPCLKEMGKDFVKFTLLVIVLYLGFLTTFALLGRDTYQLSEMVLILTKIFFGSSYIGFDIMDKIDPVLGAPLMIIFVILTNILLLGALTGIMSNSFMRVTNHAREEYLYVTSVYVLEASTSNRLTHFYPPFNFLAFLIFWPWSLVFPTTRHVRTARIALLKITHLPIMAAIQAYEFVRRNTFEEAFEKLNRPSGPKKRVVQGATARNHLASGLQRPNMPSPVQTKIWKPVAQKPEDDAEEETAVDTQLRELHRKIDALTTAVLAIQESQVMRARASG